MNDPGLEHIPTNIRRVLLDCARSQYDCSTIAAWYRACQQASPAFDTSQTVPSTHAPSDDQRDLDFTVDISGSQRAPPAPPKSPSIFVSSITNLDADSETHEGPSFVFDHAKPFCCHICRRGFVAPKYLIRHVDQVCMQTREWCCFEPGCDARYSRSQRFRQHHKTEHLCCNRTPGSDCAHENRALQRLAPRHALGCGFCSCNVYFIQNQRGFLQHLIEHYKNGDTLRTWTAANQILSLLQRPEVQPTWHVCVRRCRMNWDMVDSKVLKHFVRMLEGDVASVDLGAELRHLAACGGIHSSQFHRQQTGAGTSLSTSVHHHFNDGTHHRKSIDAAWGQLFDDLILDPALREDRTPHGTRGPGNAYSPFDSLNSSHRLPQGTASQGSAHTQAYDMLGEGTSPVQPSLPPTSVHLMTPPVLGSVQTRLQYPSDYTAFVGGGVDSTYGFGVTGYDHQHGDPSNMPTPITPMRQPATGRGDSLAQMSPTGFTAFGHHTPSGDTPTENLNSANPADPPYFCYPGSQRATKRRRTLPSVLQNTLDTLQQSDFHGLETEGSTEHMDG